MIKKMVPDKNSTASAVGQFMDKATSQMLKSSGLPGTTAADGAENQPLKPLMINVVGTQSIPCLDIPVRLTAFFWSL